MSVHSIHFAAAFIASLPRLTARQSTIVRASASEIGALNALRILATSASHGLRSGNGELVST